MDVDAVATALVAAGRSRKTIHVYCSALRRAERWFAAHGADLETADAMAVRTYSESLPRTRSSRALARSALRAYWSATGRENPPIAAFVVPTHPKMRCRALDDVDAHALARAARRRGDRKGLAVLFGLCAGLRREEIATLRWRDVGADGWLTVVGKGAVTRSMPLHPVLIEALAALAPARPHGSQGGQGAGWLFLGADGAGPVNPTTIWLWVRTVAREAGLGPVATHVLRHTALSVALDATHDLRAVQMLAGHARPETTAGYTRVRRDRLVAAVAALGYGEAMP